jgi:GTP-binding protein HflX
LKQRSYSTVRAAERAILVGTDRPGGQIGIDESMAELGRLADTAGLLVLERALQALRRPDPATFIGKGKVEEVAALRVAQRADVVVFDDPLTPAQQRNLTAALGCKVIDRSALILDIFAQHARSVEGKLQVELAQLEYLLPRLTRQWTHLSRLGGGVGTRGPGETQLEVDRRRVRERVGMLKQRLAQVERTRLLHRSERSSAPCATVSLVGYTNAGKSTLMRRLTGADVLVGDRLFATLDPTVRRMRLPGGLPTLVADTVGFIHKLPHQVVEAFKSTLEQVAVADVLVHVVDLSHSGWREHVQVVRVVLDELGAGAIPVRFAYNKVDVAPPALHPTPTERTQGDMISAARGDGIAELLAHVEELLSVGLTRIEWEVPVDRGDVIAAIQRAGRVVETALVDGKLRVTALVPAKLAGQLRKAAPDVRDVCG